MYTIIQTEETKYRRKKISGNIEVTTEVIVLQGREITIQNGMLISSKELTSTVEEKVTFKEIEEKDLDIDEILKQIESKGNSKSLRQGVNVAIFLGLK